ncbi:MAG: hypothetical protein ACTHMY_24830 [Solirubrobacteraceae bacterium]
MSALAHPSGRPRGRRAALIVVAALVAVLAAILVIVAITGGRSTPQAPTRLVGQPAPGPLSDARHAPDPAAASAARTFLSGYLAFIYGEGSLDQIRDASPKLIALLGKAHPPPARAHPPRPRLLALGAHEASGSVLHVTALITDGIARYPMGIVIVRGPGGWQTTELSSDE